MLVIKLRLCPFTMALRMVMVMRRPHVPCLSTWINLLREQDQQVLLLVREPMRIKN